MLRNILSSESCCITTLRSLAMIMIVACHIVLSYGSNYYAVLNMVVQIFFVISAFLYAQKEIACPKPWLMKRFFKLYPPLFIFLICAFSLLFVVHPELFSFKKVLLYFMDCQYFLGKEQYEELDHLWFMTPIFICYLVTPFLQRISKYGVAPIWILLFVIGANYYFTNGKIDWVLFYSISYLLFRQNKNVPNIIIIGMIIVLLSVLPFMTWDIVKNYDWRRLLAYDLTSVLLLILSMKIFNHFNWINTLPVVKWISSYSFELYIVHNFYIHGSFSCSYLTPSIPINIALIILLSILSAAILKKVSTIVILKFQ